MRGGIKARALAGWLLGCVIAACSRPEMALEPVYRLDQEIAGRRMRSLCEVGGELRPSIGCLPARNMSYSEQVVGDDRRVRVALALPATERLRPRLISVRCWPSHSTREPQTDVFFVPQMLPEMELDLEMRIAAPGETVKVAVHTHDVPAQGERVVTRPLEIEGGAMLQVGLGLDPIAVQAGAAPAEFRIAALTQDGERHELLRRTVTPAEAGAWLDERVDLSAFAGRVVEFAFESLARPDSLADPLESFTAGLWGAPQILAPRPAPGRSNLVLISLDTLRADYVGRKEHGRSLTPVLDSLAAQGALFTDVLTTYPSTTAAHMSLFTGTLPRVHGVSFPTHLLPPSIPTLPERLASSGFVTVAVTEGGMLTAPSGFARGFDFYTEFGGGDLSANPRQIERTFATGADWLARHPGERFFLFLHTYQVHHPYDPPPEYAVEPGEDAPQVERDRYAGEVRFADAAVGQLLARLRELGVLDRSILVVTSDHGEEFFEHGGIGHANRVYDEVMRIPLVMWGPGRIPVGLVSDAPASILDLKPTLLALFGISAGPGLLGYDLFASPAERHKLDSRIRFAEGPAKRNPLGRQLLVRERHLKWILREHQVDRPEIYDLARDPGEQKPLDDPLLRMRGQRLAEQFQALVDTTTPREKPSEQRLDGETEGKLRALGYIE